MGGELFPADRQTDVRKLIFTLRNFEKATNTKIYLTVLIALFNP